MQGGLTTSTLLDYWERGRAKSPLLRALDLLTCVYPEADPEQIQELPIGLRDSLLLEIREGLFGRQLICLAGCPACGEHLEIALDTLQLRSQPFEAAGKQPYALSEASYEVQFRLPNSADMAVLAGLQDSDQARRVLFERCVQQASRSGASILAGDLPEELVERIASRMAQIDPQADIEIEMICPNCSQGWSTNFDIVSILWSEINAWALRILREVYQLASAFSWSEAEILALSPMRRQIYLELVG